MANESNLLKGKATQFKSGEHAAAAGRKGGKVSGARKARKKSMKDAAQTILNGTYKDSEGNDVTGMDQIILTLFKIATDANNRQCTSAIRLLREITGDDITAEQQKLFEKKLEQMDADIAYRIKATEEMGWN